MELKEIHKQLATMEQHAQRIKYRRSPVLSAHEKIERCIRSLVQSEQVEAIRRMIVLYMRMDGSFGADGLIKLLVGRMAMLEAGPHSCDPRDWDEADFYQSPTTSL